jgi:uncharacterized repeat protein (TIGR01451 family)
MLTNQYCNHQRLWGKIVMAAVTVLAVAGLTSTVLADAISLTLASADGIWSNAQTGSGGDPTCIRYNNTVTVGDENQVAYGRTGSSCPPSLDLTQQSGFGFDGSAPPALTFDSGEVFLVGELTHYNRSIYADDKLQYVDLQIDLAFSDPVISTSLDYTIELDETTNYPSGGCPYGDEKPCDDKVGFVDTIPDEVFGPIGGTYYTLKIVGFAPGEPGTCEYVPGETINEFVTEEGAESHACLFGQVLIAAPSIDIEKNPPSQTIDYNGTATFDITVTNEGNSTLSNVVVTDALAPDCDRSIASLAAGESTTYTCTQDNVTEDLTNTIEVTGDYLSSSYSDTDAADVNVRPSISVSKSASPTSVVEPGDTVTFDVTVTNEGAESATLTNLIDDIHGDLNGRGDCVLPQSLPIGGSYSCSFTATVSGNAGDTEIDTITATAVDDEGSEGSNSGSATVTITGYTPTSDDITVVKNATPDSVVEPGGLVTFDVTVTNTGSEDLTLTSLVDDIHGDLNGQGDCVLPQALAAGGGSYSCSFTAAVSGNAGDIETDTITAAVADDEGNSAANAAQATVTITDADVSVDIVKTASDTSIPEPGSNVDYTLTITNNSSEPVTIVALDDTYTLSAECNALVNAELGVGASVSCQYTVDFAGADAGAYTNAATVTVRDDEGNEDSDSDSETLHVAGIRVNKSADPDLIHSGDLVEYTYEVTNPGDEPLSDIAVSDDKCATVVFDSGDGNGNGLLDPGETWVYTCSSTLTQDTTNTVTATGAAPSRTTVGADDTASVDVITPDIDLTVTASADETYPNKPVELTFSATNTGDTTLYDVDITFDNGTPGDTSDDFVVCTIAVLDVGESLTCDETVVVTVDTTYGGTAQGQDVLGKTVEDTDTEPVVILQDPGEGTGDQDGDGTPDFQDEDLDGDGIPNSSEGDGDSDGDGIPDYRDEDSDNDGIPDSIEGNVDTDGDGIPDYLDEDSDGDGIPDSIEGNVDTDGDGVPDYLDEDSDGDGIPDSIEGNVDTDGDGIPDYRDLDSDNDGIPDSVEAVCTPGHGSGFPCDTDGDDTPDYVDTDSDNDGIPDSIEGADDADGDGIPNYRDLDSDGDGIPDEVEGYSDADGDDIPNFLDLDSDGDGLLDEQEWSEGPGDPLAGCTAGDPVCFDNDVDDDGTPNFLDDDSDGDGIPDGEEGLGDEDDDGIPDWIDPASTLDEDDYHYVFLPFIFSQ